MSVTTDTDALLATVREALERYHAHGPLRINNGWSAALDSLAAELGQTTRSYVAMNAALQGLGREKGELEAELERVKAERDEQRRIKIVYQDRTMEAEARLDKALSALREIDRVAVPGMSGPVVGRIARAAIAEIEGEA